MATYEGLYDVVLRQKNHELRDHLRNHLTDGRWHDDCIWCGHRRVHGGTGQETAVKETDD